MSSFQELDPTDRRILKVVQHEGRISLVDLAEKVNLTKSPCQVRLKRLEKEGYIRGYKADVNPVKVGRSHLVFVQVKLDSTNSQALNMFNEAVKAISAISACHMLSGGYDYLLKVRTTDMASYRELLGEVIADLPGVYQTSSFPVMEEVKDSTYVEIGVD